jgi:uncharacterized membrane protein YphA (DoxX/SURF4 family)
MTRSPLRRPPTEATASSTAERQAFLLLRTAFTVAPIVFGLDKFFDLLTDWERYLAPWMNHLVPGSAHTAMLLVGVVEIVAGLLVATRPRYGGYVVALWLAGIIVDLVTLGTFYDVALRDLGLLLAALALARLAASPAAVSRRGLHSTGHPVDSVDSGVSA